MQVSWLKHLLADRGIHGDVVEAQLVSRGGELMLDVRIHANDAKGKRFLLFDADAEGSHRVAEERHLVPIGGMVFEPVETRGPKTDVTVFGEERTLIDA